MSTQTTGGDVAAINDSLAQLKAATQRLIDGGHAADVPDEAIAEALYTAARLFSAKKDRVGHLDWPLTADALTATETVVLVAALLDAADVNIFDMAIWYRRVE
jgi:hypothetical protein